MKSFFSRSKRPPQNAAYLSIFQEEKITSEYKIDAFLTKVNACSYEIFIKGMIHKDDFIPEAELNKIDQILKDAIARYKTCNLHNAPFGGAGDTNYEETLKRWKEWEKQQESNHLFCVKVCELIEFVIEGMTSKNQSQLNLLLSKYLNHSFITMKTPGYELLPLDLPTADNKAVDSLNSTHATSINEWLEPLSLHIADEYKKIQ